jgi:cytosine/adenosine deaminase-related metal-dependent hydrolase
MTRFIQGDFLFSAHTGFVPEGVVACDDSGVIHDVLIPGTHDIPQEKVERVRGIVTPGFVNAHAHLELSHLKSHISRLTGISGFATELMDKRDAFDTDAITNAIQLADQEMYSNGIVAVGDISNNAASISAKQKSRIHYHTFCELIALHPAAADVVMDSGMQLRARYETAGLRASLAPHAPYSVSPGLMKKIVEENSLHHSITTIHNQESKAESQFTEHGIGKIQDIYDYLGIDTAWFAGYGRTSLQASLPNLLSPQNLILVHNTFTSPADIRFTEELHQCLYWCFCPNANLYIEGELPDFYSFYKAGVRIVIGTDSLASNDALDIVEELKVIQSQAPEIPMEQVLTWATHNGAQALQLDWAGTFESGKKPGVVAISDVDRNLHLTRESKATRLL